MLRFTFVLHFHSINNTRKTEDVSVLFLLLFVPICSCPQLQQLSAAPRAADRAPPLRKQSGIFFPSDSAVTRHLMLNELPQPRF